MGIGIHHAPDTALNTLHVFVLFNPQNILLRVIPSSAPLTNDKTLA